MRLASLKNVALCSLLLGACMTPDSTTDSPSTVDGGGSRSGASPAVFAVTQLVTNETDPDLVNPWGIVGGEGVFWIADEDTGKVSVYDGQGRPSTEYPTGHFNLGEGITGVAHNEDEDAFLLADGDEGGDTGGGCGSGSGSDDGDDNDDGDNEEGEGAEFLFARLNGTIIGINDEAPVEGVPVVDRTADGAVYIGVALVDSANGPLMLAADFANARIDVFDSKFNFLNSRMFADPQMPEGFAPFNVRTLGDRVYVMYAKQGEDGEEEVGPGLGAVTVFDLSGHIVGRISSTDSLNAPWGATIIGDTLFVGNFGDGHINMFDVSKLSFLGQISDQASKPIELEGLWGLEAGSDDAGKEGVLYFVSGPEDETAGVFGRIEPVIN